MTDRVLTEEHSAYIEKRWAECVQNAGLDADGFHREFQPNDKRGTDLKELYRASDGRYVSKLFLELQYTSTKEGHGDSLSWWQVAERAAAGGEKYIAIWQEANNALFRRRQLTWSHGSAAFFGVKDLAPEALDDADGVAEQPTVKETLRLIIPGKVWDEAWRRDRWFLSTLLTQAARAEESGDWGVLLALVSVELSRQRGGQPTTPFASSA